MRLGYESRRSGMGHPVWGMDKAKAKVLSEIIFGRVFKMKISARNVLKGKVKSLVYGPVSAEITVQLAGGEEMVSIITRTSAEDLALSEGKEVFVVVKASNVMIAME